MTDRSTAEPEKTAVRVALWRAMHVQVDPPPHVLHDELGLRLIAPPADWRQRPDMDPQGTRGFRAGVVVRARFIEDLVAEGDLVAVRGTWRGTHQGPFRGVPPIGRRIELSCMAFWRIAGGQIRESWNLIDLPTLLRQLQG